MRVPEEPVFIDHFRQNTVLSSLHLKSTVHVGAPQKAAVATLLYSVEPTLEGPLSFVLFESSPIHLSQHGPPLSSLSGIHTRIDAQDII